MTAIPETDAPLTTVALVTLGCARNEVDSEELAGRLEAGGFRLVDDPEDADTVMVNTCGFVEAAKKDSVDTLLAGLRPQDRRVRPGGRGGGLHGRALRQGPGRVAARGRRRARASTTTPTSPPSSGRSWPASSTTRTPRRTAAGCCRSRPASAGPQPVRSSCPGTRSRPPTCRTAPPPTRARARSGAVSTAARWRRSSWPAAATGAARSARSRPSAARSSPAARATCSARPAGSASRASGSCSWSARTPRPTARTSATCGCSRRCCPSWRPSTVSSGSGCPTCSRPRPGPAWSPRSPATPGVAAYYDLSFQHASHAVLRRMRRFGDPESFLGLIEQIRSQAPLAGIRSNVIVGFPGETERGPRDAVRLPGRRPDGRGRRVRLLRRGRHRGRGVRRQARRGRDPGAHRARHPPGRGAHRPSAPRSGSASAVEVLLEDVDGDDAEGRAAHQGPEVDGTTTVTGLPAACDVGRRHHAPSSPARTAPTSWPRRSRDRCAAPAPPSNWNLPNALTTLRIVMVPFFGWALLVDGGESVLWRLRRLGAVRASR